MPESTLPLTSQGNRIGLWLIRALVFAAFFDLFVQYPVAAPYAVALGASSVLVGLIVAAYSIANLLANVGAGIVLDRWGRTRPLLIGLIATAAVVAGYTLVRSPIELLALRLLHGLVVAVLAPGAFALAGDVARAEDRARVMGSTGAVIAVAAIVAPAFAGVVQERGGFHTVFLFDATLLLVVTCLLWLFRAHLRPLDLERSATVSDRTRWSTLLRQQFAPYATIFGFTVALGVLVTHVPARLQALDISPAVRGAAFSLYGLLAAAVMISPVSGRLIRQQWSIGAAVGAGMIALGLLIASGLGMSSPTIVEWTTLWGAVVFGFGFGVLFPAVTAEVARRVPRQARGRAFGFFYAVYSLGVILGALAAGWLAEFGGLTSGWPFVAGALVVAGGAVIPLVERRVREEAAV